MLTKERVTELRTLKARVAALSNGFPSEALLGFSEFLEEVAGYLVSIDEEIEELASRIDYLEDEKNG